MPNARIEADYAVIGAGPMGLCAAKVLGEQMIGDRNATVVVLERAPELSSGSAANNVRIGRSGAHDMLRPEVSPLALTEARRARRSLPWMRKFAPQAFNPSVSTFAAFYGDEDPAIFEARTREEDIRFTPISTDEFRAANPGVNTRGLQHAALLDDASIRSRALWGALRDRILEQGGTIFTDAEVLSGAKDNQESLIRIGDTEVELRATAYVAAAGYGSEEVYRAMVDPTGSLGLGFSREYVLGTPRITNHTILSFGRGDPEISTLDDVSLFVRAGAAVAEVIPEPSFDVPDYIKTELPGVVQDLVPGINLDAAEIHGCLNLDTANVPGISADTKTVQHGIIVFPFPGMMTVAIDVADQVVGMLPPPDRTISPRMVNISRPMDPPRVAPYRTETNLGALISA